jgi:hypothetical protein
MDGLPGSSSGAVKLYGGDGGDVVELDPRKPVTPELVRLVLVAQNAKLVRLAGGPVVAAHESVRRCQWCGMVMVVAVVVVLVVVVTASVVAVVATLTASRQAGKEQPCGVPPPCPLPIVGANSSLS